MAPLTASRSTPAPPPVDWRAKYIEARAAHNNLLAAIPRRVQMERDQAVLKIVKDLNKIQNFCRVQQAKVVLPISAQLQKCLEAAGFLTFEPTEGTFFDPLIHEIVDQVVEEANLAASELVVSSCHALGIKNRQTGACVM